MAIPTFTYVNLEGISTTTTLFKTAVTRASNGSTITLDSEYSFQSGDATTETSGSKTLTIEGARIQTTGNHVTISGPWDLTYKTVSQLKGKSSGKITFSSGARITIYETNSGYGYAVCNMQGNAILEVTDHSTFLVKPYYNSNDEFVREGYFLNESGGTVSVAGKSRFLADRMNNTGTNTTTKVTDNSLFQIGTFDSSGNFTGGALTSGNVFTVTSSTFAAGSVSNSGSTFSLTDSVATIGSVSAISGDVLLSNTGTVSVAAANASRGILSLTGLALDDGYYTVTVTPAGGDTPVAGFNGISLPVAGGALSVPGSFTAGTEYTVSIEDTPYTAVAVTAAPCSLTVWGKATNSKKMEFTGGVLVDVKNNFANNTANSVFTVTDSTFNAGSFSNSNSAASATFTNSTVSVSGTVSNSGIAAMTGTDVTVGDTSNVSNDILFTNSGTLNFVKSSGVGSFTVYGKGKNTKNLTVSGGAVFDVKNDFNNEVAASVLTVTDSTFKAGWFRNSNTAASATFTNSTVIVSGTVSNSGIASFTDVSMSVGAETDAVIVLTNGAAASTFNLTSTGASDSTLTVCGELKNVGTLSVKTAALSVAVTPPGSDTTVSVVVRDSSDQVVYSNASFAVSEGAASISIFADNLNAGETYSVSIGDGGPVDYEAFSTAASLTVNGKVTNTNTSANHAVLSVDAWSTFSADSFVNKYGDFHFVYNPDYENVNIASFDNANGIITIDITEYVNNRASKPIVTISGLTFSAPSKQGTIRLVKDDGTGTLVDATDVFYTLSTNNEIVLGPKTVFVNARWAEGADGHEDIPSSIMYNGQTYTIGVDSEAYGDLQEAIGHASDWATIVFFNTGAPLDVEDFKFYTQGIITVDKNLFFESNVTNKAVKIDSLKISTGCTVEFRSGLYSMGDFLDNEGGTLKIVDNTRFNADLIKNANGTITLDKSSHLVAASIDAGTVEVRAGFAFNDLRWIERPYAAKIGDNVTIHLVYPETSSSPHEQDGVVYETRTIEGKQYNVVVETINPGDQVFVKVENGQYICYGTAAHHGGFPPEGDWESFYAATEYGGLQLIDDEFDLNPDSGDTYSTAAIYVNNTTLLRTAELSATLEAASKTLTVNEAGLGNLAQGQYSCTVTAGDSILNGVFIVAVEDNVLKGTVNFVSNLDPGTYSIKVADPKFVATAAAGAEEGNSPFLTLTGTGLEAGDYRYSITTSDGILTGNCVVSDGGVTIENNGLAAGTAYTAVLTKNTAGSTFEANNQNLDPTDADHKVTVSTEYEDNPIVYDSFMGAMNSVYIDGHTIGTPDAGMVVRLQEGTYREGDFSVAKVQNSKVPLYIGTGKNIIVEPDRWMDEEGQWHYDNVSLILGGTFGQPESVNQMTFYKLKNLTVDSWVVGRDKTLAENSVINFVDIEDLVINVRMKPQGGATVRILNCNVTSKMHFSVAGGTLIIENSHVKLTGSNGSGALSTENNYVGSGTVIVRNSVFELTDSTASDMVVNLKVNAEFTISGTCTVDGVFTNLDTSGKDTDTCISFRDAILDENTSIRAGTNDSGAALRFEGYNVLDGSTVVQKGNQDMTIEVGSTLDMSGGASITVGGGVDVSNCGNITLDNATISAGSFTNQGNLTLTDGSGVNLVHEHIETGDDSNFMVLEFDEFYAGKSVKITVTDKDGNPVALVDDTVTPMNTGDGKYTATIYKAEGNFLSGVEYTVTHDGYFVNSENGTLTVELQSDGSLGISKGDGTPVDIENSGTIYIDLSKTDMPEDHPYIILEGLSGEGEVVVIGGGGEYSNTPVTTGGSDIPHINLFTPSTETLYVNGEWHNPSVYKRGKNVGSYTYFGYNAFDNNPDNDPGTNRDLKFTTETSKVVYYGGSNYTDLDLSAAANNAPNQLTLTTLGSMSTAKLTATFTVDAGDARTVSIVVKDGKGKVIEKQNYSVAASASSIENAVFYSSSLSEDDAPSYTVSIVDAGVTTPLETTAWSVADLTGDRDTATLASLTTDADQIVTLSGATIYLTAATNNGTLKVGTGESAILEIPVAPSGSIRDVKVAVKIGSNEEYHTVQAAAGESSVTVESKSFAPGQEYSVSLSDTKQYSAVSNKLSVDVVSGAARTINVVVRNADGVKYTFTNVEVGAGDTKVTLNPIDALDDTSATVSGSPAGITVTNYGGSLTLHVTGDVAAQKVDVYVQKTVGDTVYRFDYTFNVDAHTGSEEKTYTVSTRLSSDGYYYVEASEPEITATAQVNGISGAQVKAGNVTNNGTGTIVVASQKDVGSLSLTGIQSAEARTIRVKIMDGDFTVGTYDVDVAGTSTSATVVSSDFIAEKTYTATVTDTYYATGTIPTETGTAPKLTFALDGITAPTYAVQVTDRDSGDIIGNYTATKITTGDDEGMYTVVSGEFAAGTYYTVSATAVTPIEVEAEDDGSANRLAFTVGAGAARTVTAVVKHGTTIVGTFDVEIGQSYDPETKFLVSSEFTDLTEGAYTVSIANENVYDLMEGTPATIKHFEATAEAPRKSAKLILDVDRNDSASRWIEVVTGGNTYSLFVEKGAKTAELESENFRVGTEYSDVKIKDAYSAAIEAKAGEGDTKTLTLTGLSSSDNVIRPDGPIVRTLKATVRDGAVVVDTYTITTIDSKGNAVISDSRLTAGKEYTVELSDEKTVVATAETLSVFDSTGNVTNDNTITVTDATFNAGTLTNESTGTITLTNSQLNVSGTLTNNATTTALNPDYGIFMDIDSLITAGSITNNGTITIDATTFNPAKTDMKKVIDLETGALTGTGDLILNAAAGIGVLYDDAGHDYWVVAADQSTVYVNSAWATDENGLAHKIGDNVGDKLYYGYNAFGSFTEAYAETLKVNPYKLNGAPQTITTIEVYGPTAEESAKGSGDLPLFWTDKVVNDISIVVHSDPNDPTAAVVIPFNDGDWGFTLNPDGATKATEDAEIAVAPVTITIDSGITIRTSSEEGYHECSGTVYLNKTKTTGVIRLDGAIDSAREIKIYGKTDVSNTGSLNAATLLWINSGATGATAFGFDDTITVTGTGGNWTSAPQVSAENILFSSGKLEITDSKVASKGLVFGYDDGVAAGNILLESNCTDWTLNNIGTQTVGGSAKGTYQFSNGSIMVKGDDANTINNAGTVNPGEVAIGSGVTLELANNTLTVQKGDAEDSTGAILNSGTIRTDLNSLITAESIDNTNGTITVDVAGYVSTGGMQKVIDLKTDDLYELIASDSSTVNFTVGGEAASGYYLAYDHSAYDYWVTDAPQTTLYVNEDWASGSYNYGDYIGTVDEINRYYGYNAFSSFVDALTVASDLTINNANFADGITIDVESDITHDLIPAGEGSLNLVFQGAIKVNGHGRTVTVYGDRYLRLGAATNTTSFVFDPAFVFNYQQVGSVDTGKYGLLFGTSPANSLGSVTMNGTFTSGNRLQAITGSLTLNEDVTANTYVYLGSADMTIEKPVESQIITFTGDAIVNSDATLTTPANGNILIYGELTSGDDPSIDVLIKGTGNNLYETIPQVTTGSLVLTEGSLETRDTHIELKSNLSFCDDYDRYTEDGVDYNGKVVLTSEDTWWDIGGDINVRFFTDQDYILGSYATLTFSESTVNVGGNVINAAYSTTSGQDSDTYLDEAPAMTIQLVGTYMEVNGRLENDGSIEVKDSTVSAGSLDNDGTFTVKGESELHIDELDGTITLTDGGSTTPTTLKDTDIYGKTGTGGKLVAQGDLDFAATTSNILSDIELDATGHTVKVLYGTFKVDAASQIKAANFTNSGTFIVDAADFTYGEDEIKNVKIIDAETSVTLGTPGTNYEVINTPSGKQAFLLQDDAAKDVYLTNQDQTVQYVNTTYSASKDVDGNGGHFYGYNAESSIADAVTAAGTSGTIVVTGGEFGTSNAPTFEGVETTISGGNFSTSVCGGYLFSGSGELEFSEPNIEKSISLTITGGIFKNAVFAGDRVNRGSLELTRTGNIETVISGGEFNNAVGGAMALTYADDNAEATLDGSVTLTIKSGTFNNPSNRGWIYGGCIASNKTVAGGTTITGNVTVKLDATSNDISIANLVVGSYGAGNIGEYTKLILTGGTTEVKRTVTATGEIWGGSSSDSYKGSYLPDSGNRKLDTTVGGSRILSFTGFNGTLTSGADKIRAFSDIEVRNGSDATIGGSANLSDVENWTFENGSSLAGDFTNDFYGDTLTLVDFTAGTYDLMSSSDSSTFNGYDRFASIQLKDALGNDLSESLQCSLGIDESGVTKILQATITTKIA